MNPATFLRALGPEPWNVCYVEPSVRPDDSRYGENPNRVQRHTQFQVVLKPDPGNPQELYLGSLEALGLDTGAHDVRFVEDNWESPVLGAWGLGWEVWLDGQEISQFTYFQQVGSVPCAPVSVEITYGLERIIMALQGVEHFKDIRYNDAVTYGELFMQNEIEQSRYNLDEANVADQRARFDLFEKEALAMLEKRLPVPAYDHVLKASHAFNVLDARGAVGVTERAEYFARMRKLARDCAALWVDRRQELGFPLGEVDPPAPPEGAATGAVEAAAAAEPFLLEIGTEELPPDEVDSAVAQLERAVPALLEGLKLPHGAVTVNGTPRRLAVEVEALATRQPDREERTRGPPAKAAFDAEGAPTKAILGFCKKNGAAVEDVERVPDAKGVEYCWVAVKEEGQAAGEVLGPALAQAAAKLAFRKSMKWDSDATFSRPVRWLVALHGARPVPLAGLGLAAGGTSRGLRRGAQATPLPIGSAGEYRAAVEGCGIVLEAAARRDRIWRRAGELAAAAGGRVPEEAEGALLSEVANLVEAPTPLLGGFDPRFLELPKELLAMVMKKHQRYFPVEDAAGALLPHFITVANGAVDVPTVRAGNEAVLRARFQDAEFFYRSDCAAGLAAFRPKLQGTVFHKELGTMLQKAERTEALVAPLAGLAGLEGDRETATRAAHLARADLATATVMEMTALAGFMGQHYAGEAGLPAEVGDAIFESVLPRHAGDRVARSGAGILVSLADKLDALVGLAAVGCLPKATADPFGLRRVALGVLQTLVANDVGMDLAAAVEAAATAQPVAIADEVRRDALQFLQRRLEQMLIDQGHRVECVRAVLAAKGANPAEAARFVAELDALVASNRFQSTMNAFSRPTRLTRGKDVDRSWAVNPDLFEQDEERALHGAYLEARERIAASGSLEEFLAGAEGLVAPLEGYMENVFVMAEDEGVRKNRLKFLSDVAALTEGVIDFAELPGF